MMNKRQKLKQKKKKTIREHEEEIEKLKELVAEADKKGQLEELKTRQEQELQLMNFKLEREVELKKKAEEALAFIKSENEKLNEQFELETRKREKKLIKQMQNMKQKLMI